MKFSRRGFLYSGSAFAALLLSGRAEAWTRGAAATGTNAGRTSINVPNGGAGLMNLASAWNPFATGKLTSIDVNGYPTAAPASNASAAMPLVPNYYGQYVLKWSGQAALAMPTTASIIYAGGAFCVGLTQGGGPAGTGYVPGNFNTTNTATNPRIVFKIGTLVTAVSGGSGSLVTITTVGPSISTGTQIMLNQGISSNLVTGPNSDGSWTVTNVSSTSFTLNGSTGVVSPTVTGSGGVGTQTECVIQSGSTNTTYLSSGTYSSFTSLVICTLANETPLSNGLFYDQIFVNQLLALKGTPLGVGRGGKFWLRTMDISGVQASFESDFSQRIPTTQQSWTASGGSGYLRNGYLTPSSNAAITNGGGDAYTCADPSVTTLSGGNYIDNAIVQGFPSATNTGGNPTLAVGTGPAKPIFGFGNTWTSIMLITVAPTTPGTDVLQFTFQASWLNSGTPLTANYSTVAGDSNKTTLANNLQTFFNSSATNMPAIRASGIVFNNPFNSAGPTCTQPCAQAGRLTITYSGTAAITPSTTTTSSLGTGFRTFAYNYLMDGWIQSPTQGLNCYQPLESIVELCNRVGADCWTNLGFTKGAYVTAFTQFFADSVTGLTSGLRLGIEAWNEVWNPGANPHGQLQVLGRAFTFNDGANGSDGGYTGLRTIQYMNLAAPAWSGKGRNSGDLWQMNMSQLGNDNTSGYFLYQVKGTILTTANTWYNSYSGLNGGAGADHSIAPNRPVDFPNVFIGQAPYWNNRYLGVGSFTQASQLVGTVAQNALLLQAAFDYANVSASQAFTSLVSQFNHQGTLGPQFAYDFSVLQVYFTNQETIAATFDSGRAVKVGINHYEGGASFGIGANGNNGVQSKDNQAANIASGDITALATQYSNLGWTTAQLIPYTTSGTGSLTEMATMVLVMLQGWKYDLNPNGTAAGTSSYSNMIQTSYFGALQTTSGGNRETHAGQYGYAGSNWALFYSAYNSFGPAYQNFNAIQAYNT